MCYILVMTTAGAALKKCHNAGVNEGFGAWRQFVMEWEPKLRTRYVGLLMNVLVYRHSNQAGSIRENRTRLREPVHKDRGRRHQDGSDDAGDGGHASERALHPEQRQNHKLESDARGHSRDHENTTVHRQSTNAKLGANPKSKGKGKESKGKGKGKDIKGKDKVKDVKKIVQESEKPRSEKVLLQQNRSREGRVQTETERPCRGRRETGGSVATSTRHSSGCAVTVLTPRRQTLVNVCHSHALCELRDGRNNE